MKRWPPSSENRFGLVLASTACASSGQVRTWTGAPLNVVPLPAAPTQRSRPIGWSMMPSTGQPSSMSAMSVPKIGRPAMKLTVPSIGSSTQLRPVVPSFTPNSSPCTPSRGASASSRRRIAVSAARSASVTGEASAFDSLANSARKNGRIASPAASARRLARARSAGVTASVEQAGDRAFVGDAADGFADQRGDGHDGGCDCESLAASVGQDGVGDDQFGEHCDLSIRATAPPDLARRGCM